MVPLAPRRTMVVSASVTGWTDTQNVGEVDIAIDDPSSTKRVTCRGPNPFGATPDAGQIMGVCPRPLFETLVVQRIPALYAECQ